MIIRNVFTKIISVIFILLILTTHLTAFANEDNITPTPDITPTPTEVPAYSSTSQNSINESETYNFSYPENSSDSANINSGDNVISISSDSALLDIKINTDNDIKVNRNTEVISQTGSNSVSDNISISGPITLSTGDVLTQATLSTVVNTNVVGLNVQPILHNFFTPLNSDLNLSPINGCQSFNEGLAGDIVFNENTGNNVNLLSSDELTQNVGVYTNNNAEIINNVTLSADTGNNHAVDNIGIGVYLQTGNATSTADIVNIANTNLIGQCGLFAIVNIFDGGEASIILPYEGGYINPNSPSTSSTSVNSGNSSNITSTSSVKKLIDVTASNSAILDSAVDQNTNTGNNSIIDVINFNLPISMTVGSNDSYLNTIDMGNMNIVDDNFLYLKVNHFGHFLGNVLGWDGQVIESEDYFILYAKTTPDKSNNQNLDELQLASTNDELIASDSSQFDSILDVEAINNATIINNLNLDANTGGNSAGKFNTQLSTGNAQTGANIFNLANLNIIGSNWYFGVVNIFEDFFGDIIFPRPDLSINKEVSLTSAYVDDTLTYSLKYVNSGQITAKKIKIVDTLPTGIDLISATESYAKDGNLLIFNIDEIVPNQTGVIYMTVKINNNSAYDLTNYVSISTDTTEPNQANNQSSVTTTVLTKKSTASESIFNSPQVSSSNTNTPNQITTYYYIDDKNIKTFHKEVQLNRLKKTLSKQKGVSKNDNTYGDILDGVNTNQLHIFMIVLMTYCVGFVSGVLFKSKISS